MCGTCHAYQDEGFPSTLVYEFNREGCSGCHNKLENPDVSWVQEVEKKIRLASRPDSGDLAFLHSTLKEEMTRTFESIGASWSEKEPDLHLAVTLEVKRLHEDRFVPEGYAVCVVKITVVLTLPDDPEPLLRREAVSRPEYAADEKEAARMAVKDGWRVLAPFVVEGVGSY